MYALMVKSDKLIFTYDMYKVKNIELQRQSFAVLIKLAQNQYFTFGFTSFHQSRKIF